MQALKFFSKLVMTIIAIAFAIAMVIWFLHQLTPLSPLITLAFGVIGTGLALTSRRTGFVAVASLIVYGLSWPLTWQYGEAFGSSACVLAVGGWFWAVLESVFPASRPEVDTA